MDVVEIVQEIIEDIRPADLENAAPVQEPSTSASREELAQPVVSFPPDDGQSGEELDQESLDQILGMQAGGDGDNEDGEISDEEDGQSQGAVEAGHDGQGEDEDAPDTEGSVSDQASSSASAMALSAGDAGTGRGASELFMADFSSQGEWGRLTQRQDTSLSASIARSAWNTTCNLTFDPRRK